MHNELLLELTGSDGPWWVDFIQKLIPLYCTTTDNPAHPMCDPSLWLTDVANELWKRIPRHNDLTKHDENILATSALSLILTLWNVRLRRAKAYDPRRPIALRQAASRRALRFNLALASCLLDESQDHLLFPLPEWDTPFDPQAKNGDFV